MRLLAVIILACYCVPAMAAEKELSGEEITDLLPTIIATGKNSRQTFTKIGATTYWDNGRKILGARETFGRWRVQNNLYCSQWPPSDAWACYRVVTDSSKKSLVWIGMSGNRTMNQFEHKE